MKETIDAMYTALDRRTLADRVLRRKTMAQVPLPKPRSSKEGPI